MLVAIALYFIVGCIVAYGFRRTLADCTDMMIRLLRIAAEADPDVRMMIALFSAFASLLWPAFFAAMIASLRAEKRLEQGKDVDLHR